MGAFAMFSRGDPPNLPGSDDLQPWVEAVVDAQCHLMSPQPMEEAKCKLRNGVWRQCESLRNGDLLIVDGSERRVSLSEDWHGLYVGPMALHLLANLNSIQLETTWKTFDATFVFECRGAITTLSFSFHEAGRRIRF